MKYFLAKFTLMKHLFVDYSGYNSLLSSQMIIPCRKRVHASDCASENASTWDVNWDYMEDDNFTNHTQSEKIKYVILLCDRIGNQSAGHARAKLCADQVKELFHTCQPDLIAHADHPLTVDWVSTFKQELGKCAQPIAERDWSTFYLSGDTVICPSDASEETRQMAYVEGAGIESFITRFLVRPLKSDNRISTFVVVAGQASIQYIIGRLLQVPRNCYSVFQPTWGDVSVLKIESTGNVILSQIGKITRGVMDSMSKER